MKKRNRVLKWFIGMSLILFSIGSVSGIILWKEYKKIHSEWERDYGKNIQKLLHYYHLINRKVYPKLYEDRKASSGFSDLQSVAIMTVIYDREGREIGRFAREERSIVPLNEVSPYFVHALLSTEDRDFYSHNGISYKSILRAMFYNISSLGWIQGGSTLTQQLSKVLFTNRERTLKRKVYEYLMTQEIERRFDKNSILLMYVNYIHFGHNIDGVEEAGKFYFNKSAMELTIEESAFLVGLISNPTRFSPFHNYTKSKAKHLRVLKSMSEMGFLSLAEVQKLHQAFWESQTFEKNPNPKKWRLSLNRAPYIVEEVKRQVLNRLTTELGYELEKAETLLYTKGWKIHTSIDLDLQLKAEKAIQNGLDRYRLTIKKRKNWNNEILKGIQGALVSLDPKSGEVRALVGGYQFNSENQYNRAVQSYRQPGSTFKPFVYLGALDERIVHPYSMRMDRYELIELPNRQIWNVHNSENRYLEKEIPLIEALKISSNQIAAHLILELGVYKIREIMRSSLGLEKKEALRRYPDGLYATALGAVEMTPMELARSYAMIANQGFRVDSKLILSIEDFAGIPIDWEEEKTPSISVVSKESAYQVIHMMRQVLKPGGTGSSVRKQISAPIDIAGKTGTSQKSRDLWFAGNTTELSTVVWLGHDQNKDLWGSGGRHAGSIFAEYMNFALQKIPFQRFSLNPSYNVYIEEICLDSGLIAVRGQCIRIDPHGVFIAGTGNSPADYCDWDHSKDQEIDLTLKEEIIKVEETTEKSIEIFPTTLNMQEENNLVQNMLSNETILLNTDHYIGLEKNRLNLLTRNDLNDLDDLVNLQQQPKENSEVLPEALAKTLEEKSAIEKTTEEATENNEHATIQARLSIPKEQKNTSITDATTKKIQPSEEEKRKNPKELAKKEVKEEEKVKEEINTLQTPEEFKQSEETISEKALEEPILEEIQELDQTKQELEEKELRKIEEFN